MQYQRMHQEGRNIVQQLLQVWHDSCFRYSTTVLNGERGAHSIFGIPIPIANTSTFSASANSKIEVLINVAELVIWDEESMAHNNIIITYQPSVGCFSQRHHKECFFLWKKSRHLLLRSPSSITSNSKRLSVSNCRVHLS